MLFIFYLSISWCLPGVYQNKNKQIYLSSISWVFELSSQQEETSGTITYKEINKNEIKYILKVFPEASDRQ